MSARIDWTNPITKGLSFVAPMNDPTCKTWSKYGGHKTSTITGEVAFSSSIPGKVFEFSPGAGSARIDTNTLLDLTSKTGFTFAGFVNCKVAGVNEDVVFSTWGGASAANVIIRIEPSDGSIEFHIVTTVGNPTVSAGTLVADEWYFIVCRYDGVELSVWVDGVKDATVLAETNPFHGTTSTNNVIIGDWTASANDEFDGMLGTQYAWDRDLSDVQIRSLHANPWQIFKPQRILIPLIEGATVVVGEPEAPGPPFPYHIIKQRRRGMKTLLTM